MRGTKITLGGKEYTLRFDLNAIAELGERLNIMVRLSHIQEDLLERPLPLGALRTVVWAGLIREHPEMTEQEVGSMIDLEDLPEVVRDFFGHFAGMSAAAGAKLTLETAEEDEEERAAAVT